MTLLAFITKTLVECEPHGKVLHCGLSGNGALVFVCGVVGFIALMIVASR